MNTSFEKSSITSEAARRMLEAAEQKAGAIGISCVVAIVDESGVLKAFSRMDRAPLLCVQIAQDKAYTAAGFGLSTHGWHDFIKDDPALAAGAPTGINRLIVFGGGFPISSNGRVLGGIGVSGGLPTEDMEIAQAALKAID